MKKYRILERTIAPLEYSAVANFLNMKTFELDYKRRYVEDSNLMQLNFQRELPILNIKEPIISIQKDLLDLILKYASV